MFSMPHKYMLHYEYSVYFIVYTIQYTLYSVYAF